MHKDNIHNMNKFFRNVGNCEKYPDEDVWSLFDSGLKDGNFLLALPVADHGQNMDPQRDLVSVMFEGKIDGHEMRSMHFIAFLPVTLIFKTLVMNETNRAGFYKTLYRYGFDEMQANARRCLTTVKAVEERLAGNDRIDV